MPSGPRTRRRVRQKAKGVIDPELGLRLSALRAARKLTQVQLAGTEFTPGFVSLVEHGKTRISLRAAEIFARRLDVAVSELMSPTGVPDAALETTLVRAEAELRAQRPAIAVDLARAIESQASGVMRGRIQRLIGRALRDVGRPQDAIVALEDARRTFEAAKQTELRLRTIYDLAIAHAQADALGDALTLGAFVEQALLSGELVDRTLELELLTFMAALFVTLGDFDAADARSERAKALAQDVADPTALATLYESLAATRQEQGDFEAALTYARKSLASYEELHRERSIASTWNTIGWVYVKRGQPGRAAEALQRAERLAQSSGDGRLMAYVLQSQAELEASRGNYDRALALAEESIAQPQASPRARALSLLVRAEALAKTDAANATVQQAFTAAFEALEPHGRRQLARAYQAHFEAMRERGDQNRAIASAQRALELLRPALR